MSDDKIREAAQPLNSEVYTTEASESKAKAKAEAAQPDPMDAQERFARLLAKTKANAGSGSY